MTEGYSGGSALELRRHLEEVNSSKPQLVKTARRLGTILFQRENPAVYGGRESHKLR